MVPPLSTAARGTAFCRQDSENGSGFPQSSSLRAGGTLSAVQYLQAEALSSRLWLRGVCGHVVGRLEEMSSQDPSTLSCGSVIHLWCGML